MSEKSIPIFINHDFTRPVGSLEGQIARFVPRTVTPDTMFNAGYTILKDELIGDVRYILEAKIREISVNIQEEEKAG